VKTICHSNKKDCEAASTTGECEKSKIDPSSLLSIESQGNAHTVTLKAFTIAEAAKIIENLSQ
jgi:uncharacterized protein with GYD domain